MKLESYSYMPTSKSADDLVGPHPRHGAEGGDGARGRDQGEPVADAEAEAVGEAGADGDRIVAVEVGEAAGGDRSATIARCFEILRAAGRARRRRGRPPDAVTITWLLDHRIA